MIKRFIFCTMLITAALGFSERIAHAQTRSDNEQSGKSVTNPAGLRFLDRLAQRRPARRAAFALMESGAYANVGGPSFNFSPMAAGPNLPVLGGGTLGRLTKWTGFTSSNSFIGNSTIFEDKIGNVGIGTDSPTSRLTVAGLIQSTTGGFKFPDGTVQTTSAAGSLFTVAHDATLVGNGTVSSPLGVAVPLILSGPVEFDGVIKVTNTAANGPGVEATGGTSSFGLVGSGGISVGLAGDGVAGIGGGVGSGTGGRGIVGVGGNSFNGFGGRAVHAVGGSVSDGTGGGGVFAEGGSASSLGSGGFGVIALGGQGNGAGKSGGIGIAASGGSGEDGAARGLAGDFNGSVEIDGALNVTETKNFKIDHPLDPENKYLYHAAIESSEVLNVYSGNVKMDANGEAIVRLPAWFQAINRDFRYSLTPVGVPASGLYIAQEIADGRFKIGGGVAGMKVSWQVTGVRSDRALLKRSFTAEQDKPEQERGTYLNPDAYEQPEERGLKWARHPELMRKLKQQRIEAEQKHKPNNR